MLVKPLLENTLKENYPFNITINNKREIDNGCVMQHVTVDFDEKNEELFNETISAIINKSIK
jgi:hypothetical protein